MPSDTLHFTWEHAMDISSDKILGLFQDSAKTAAGVTELRHILLGNGSPGLVPRLDAKVDELKENYERRHNDFCIHVDAKLDRFGDELQKEIFGRYTQHAENKEAINKVSEKVSAVNMKIYGNKRFVAGILLASGLIFTVLNRLLDAMPKLIPFLTHLLGQ